MRDFPNQSAHNPEPPRPVKFSVGIPFEQYLEKIALYPAKQQDLVVEITNPLALSTQERDRLLKHVSRRNYTIYHYDESNPAFHQGYQNICSQLGLTHSVPNPASGDGDVTTIEVVEDLTKQAVRYIPFTNHALKWHTDGYYNPPEKSVRSFVLHCRQPAESGGETRLLDHELVYALLYQENPAWITALAGADTMTIPANIQDGKTIRDTYCGPVFTQNAETGQLEMRYTERSRNIIWRSDADTKKALLAIRQIMDDKSKWITRIKLQPGQGVIANNVLHNRSAFSDSEQLGQKTRKLERIRFTDRINSENAIGKFLK